MKNKKIRKITNMAMLLACDVLLTRVLAINTPVIKIGFGFLAVALCGALYGPLWASAMAALGDFLGAMVFPTGAYYFGFTVTAAMTGALFGLMLRNYSVRRGATAGALNVLIIVYAINSALIAHITGTAYSAMLITRALSSSLLLIIQSTTLSLILPRILHFVKSRE